MAKRRARNPEAIVKKRTKEGRGRGTGSAYLPWNRIQDRPSFGLVSRIKGWKTKRMHSFFSNLELNFFYILEWAPEVTDIREQFPLDSEETLAIARECGLRHPCYPCSTAPLIMTTDFFVSTSTGLNTRGYARKIVATKCGQGAQLNARHEIERRYWQAQGIDWAVVRGDDIPRVLARNVGLVHDYYDLADRLLLALDEIESIARVLTSYVTQSSLALRALTSNCDQQFGLLTGTSLAVAYHLLATRRWQMDMNTEIEPCRKLIRSGMQ